MYFLRQSDSIKSDTQSNLLSLLSKFKRVLAHDLIIGPYYVYDIILLGKIYLKKPVVAYLFDLCESLDRCI